MRSPILCVCECVCAYARISSASIVYVASCGSRRKALSTACIRAQRILDIGYEVTAAVVWMVSLESYGCKDCQSHSTT